MKCQVLIDWLTFSVKETDPSKVIQTYLGMDPTLFQDTSYSLMGYSKVMRFSDILVCSEGREDDYCKDMGICVSMSGNGCRTFETMSKLTLDLEDKQGTRSVAFPALFQLLASDADANVSRIDIACDDRAGHLNMDDVLNKVQANEVNSRMTKRSTVISFNGQERNGTTFYSDTKGGFGYSSGGTDDNDRFTWLTCKYCNEQFKFYTSGGFNSGGSGFGKSDLQQSYEAQVEELPILFGSFLDFLAAVFPFLPPEITIILTFGVIAITYRHFKCGETMNDLAALFAKTVKLFSLEFILYGFTFSLWEVFLFSAVVGIVARILGEIFFGD